MIWIQEERRNRVFRGCLTVFLAAVLFGPPSWAQGTGTETLRTAVSEWVAAMQKIQEEQSRWAREKRILESNREGLEQEIADLEEAIASAKGRLESIDKEDQEKLAKKRAYDETRKSLASSLTFGEERVRRVLPLLPEVLVKDNTKLAAAVDALKKTVDFTDEQKAKDLGKRLGALMTVLTESEKIQGRTWIRGEKREVDGEMLLVTTIYFGLSVAFATDEAGTVALRGYPREDGWNFESLSGEDTSKKILELIEVASLKGEIKFVDIPLELR